MKMGLFQGLPTAVAPNAASGRAEYHGPLCNMCAPPSDRAKALVATNRLRSTAAMPEQRALACC